MNKLIMLFMTSLLAALFVNAKSNPRTFDLASTETSLMPSSEFSLNVTLTSTPVFCISEGTVTAVASGGQAPYTYVWSNGVSQTTSSSSLIFNLDGGSYTVTVTDANGDSVTDTAVVEYAPTAVQLNFVVSDESCFGLNDGSVRVEPQGGTVPFTYSWSVTVPGIVSVGSSSYTVNNLSPGVYTVTAIDTNGCTFNGSFTVQAGARTPQLDAVTNVTSFEQYIFPAITGTDLSGNEAYYTQPNGGGTRYAVGDTIQFSEFFSYPVTLYAYDASGSQCTDEESFQLTIEPTNDNIVNAVSLNYGSSCIASPYNLQDKTLENNEPVPYCVSDPKTVFNNAGASFNNQSPGSQWFKFTASSSGDALIKLSSNSYATLALYEAPTVAGQAASLAPAIACSSMDPHFKVLINSTIGNDSTVFIDALNLIPGNEYFVQVYSLYDYNEPFCIELSEPNIYTYNNGWSMPNGDPSLTKDPTKRVVVENGTAIINQDQNPSTGILSGLATLGSLHVAIGATAHFDNMALYYLGVIDGDLHHTGFGSTDLGTLYLSNSTAQSLTGNGIARLNNLVTYYQFTSSDINIDLDLEIAINYLATNNIIHNGSLTFKSTAGRTATLQTAALNTSGTVLNTPLNLTGNIKVEQYIGERIGTNKRAYRLISTPISSTATIYDQWQESGNAPVGYGTHITGSIGTTGTIDPTNGLDRTTSGNPSMFTFNETTATWQAVESTNQPGDVLGSGVPYRMYVRGDRNVDLNVNTSSSTTILRSSGDLLHTDKTMTYNVDGGNYVMIGNPYQNAVSVEQLIDDSINVTDNQVYYWDPNLGGAAGQGAYVAYSGFDNGGTGTAVPASSNNGFIQPGQAIFVTANNGANGAADMTINFKTSQIDPSGLLTGVANRVTSFTSTTGNRINMKLYDRFSYTNGYSQTDGLELRFSPNGDNNINNLDMAKVYNPDENIAVSQEGSDYIIAMRKNPETDEVIELKHYNYGDQEYTYVIDVEGLLGTDIFLVDRHMGSSTKLFTGTNIFEFAVDLNNASSINTDRFQLLFEDVTLSLSDPTKTIDFKMYPNPLKDKTLYFRLNAHSGHSAQVTVHDMTGKRIWNKTSLINSNGVASIELNGFESGVYIVKVTLDGVTLSRKLIIE